jgi:hypothetical protein
VTDAIGSFTRVEDFALSGPTDAHYMETVDDDGICTIRFGNGVQGRLASGSINTAYETGGGATGKVEAGQLTIVDGSFVDSYGNSVRLTAYNALASDGGDERETVAAARLLAPATTRTHGVTCSLDDFVINSLRVAGVARALALNSEADGSIPEGGIRVYLIPTDGGQPSAQLVEAVETIMGAEAPVDPEAEWYPHTMDQTLEVSPVTVYKTVSVRAVVWLRPVPAGSNLTAHRVAARAEIETALEDLLAPLLPDGSPNPYVDFGYNYRDVENQPAGEVALSDVFNALRDASRVRKVGAGMDDFTVNGEHEDVAILNHEFPTFGTVTLIDGDTGEEF